MCLIRPFGAGIKIVAKYVVLIPCGRLITKLFPKFAQKVRNDQERIK